MFRSFMARAQFGAATLVVCFHLPLAAQGLVVHRNESTESRRHERRPLSAKLQVSATGAKSALDPAKGDKNAAGDKRYCTWAKPGLS